VKILSNAFIDGAMLNDMQRKAVETTEGPLLILAGAGSGKTRVLTHRVAHLILDKGVSPWSILAITFTNKAAKEMKERIISMCGDAGANAWVSTFHSACVRILRQEIENMGYSRDFTIYDDDDQGKLIDRLLKEENIDPKQISSREIKSKISDAKNRIITPAQYAKEVFGDFRLTKIADVFAKYEKHLKSNNALDFDDLILKTIEIFEKVPEALQKFSSRFKYILVDEYQDTNHAQYVFVNMLASYWGNLCVVGDDDQSIYGWRGADIANILDFEKDFPNAMVIKLEQNYRSTNNILMAANKVIDNNTGRKRKQLWSDKGEGNKLRVEHLADERAETGFVVTEIGELCKKGLCYSDIAVLFRLNSQSRTLEEMLLGSGIPHRVYGGQPYYGRKEVRDAIAYMRLMVNPNDEIALRRIINIPKRGIGAATIEELAVIAENNNDTIFGIILDCDKYTLSGRAAGRIRDFSVIAADLLENSMLLPLPEFTTYLLEKTGLLEEYRKEKTEDALERMENLEELVNATTRYCQDNPDCTLSDFLINIALVSEPTEQALAGADTKGMVSLMTMHSAKGLEFKAVFVVGMEEGIFPLSRASSDPTQLEEERRLCYVAMTRAMENLYLTSICVRMLYGETRPSMRSRFLHEIPAELCESRLPSPREHTYISRHKRDWNANDGGFAQAQGEINAGYVAKTKYYNGMVQSSELDSFNKNEKYFPAMKVRHKKFGEGTVINVSGSGDDTIIKIAFDGQGIKELVAIYAPMEII